MLSLSYRIDNGPVVTITGEVVADIVEQLASNQVPPESAQEGGYYGHFRFEFLDLAIRQIIVSGFGQVDGVWGYYAHTPTELGWEVAFTAVPIADFVADPRTIEFVPTPPSIDATDLFDLISYPSPFVGNPIVHACGYISFYNA